MEKLMTQGETIMTMFQLGILSVLWGIYSEIRKLNEGTADKKK